MEDLRRPGMSKQAKQSTPCRGSSSLTSPSLPTAASPEKEPFLYPMPKEGLEPPRTKRCVLKDGRYCEIESVTDDLELDSSVWLTAESPRRGVGTVRDGRLGTDRNVGADPA